MSYARKAEEFNLFGIKQDTFKTLGFLKVNEGLISDKRKSYMNRRLVEDFRLNYTEIIANQTRGQVLSYYLENVMTQALKRIKERQGIEWDHYTLATEEGRIRSMLRLGDYVRIDEIDQALMVARVLKGPIPQKSEKGYIDLGWLEFKEENLGELYERIKPVTEYELNLILCTLEEALPPSQYEVICHYISMAWKAPYTYTSAECESLAAAISNIQEVEFIRDKIYSIMGGTLF